MTSWMVLQKPGSGYRDVEGQCYEYPSHIPHARKILEGDYLICTRPKKHAKNGKRIFGIGRIESIEEYYRDGVLMFKANYGWYRNLAVGYSFDEFGGDPRAKPDTQHSMSPISPEKETELLSTLLGDIADDADVRAQEEIINRNVSPSPVVIAASGSNNGASKFGQWLEAKMEVKGLNASSLARKAYCDPGTIRNIVSGKIKTPSKEMISKITNAINEMLPEEIQNDIEIDSEIDSSRYIIDFNPFDDSSVPSQAGVYVLYGPTDAVLYIGKSKNAQKRVRNHREKKWFVEAMVASGMFFSAEDDDERDRLERILIRFLKSKAWLNKVGRFRG